VSRSVSVRTWASLAILLAAAQACSTPPERVDAAAENFGFGRTVLPGNGFDHVIYLGKHQQAGPVLHVYIEGDGSPYLDRWTVAPDPTPRHPVMLRLMSLDPGPAVYVGRPCYFGLASSLRCDPLIWTTGRFGEPVVQSMAAVIERLKVEGGYSRLLFLAHSGGGAIAVLLARRMPDVEAVVTLAGNLDPAAWAALHGFSPLNASLDPKKGGPLPAGIRQLHYAGERDENIPPWLIRAALPSLGTEDLRVLPGVTHQCCWQQDWPAILQELVPE
jgi:pimeloyl-ACP methyl ester carboxylesterase